MNDGYVVASDSATTVQAQDAQGQLTVHNIYNNANKIFNVYKGLPLSAMTWGQGNIGPASIATLAKDFRARLSSDSAEWQLDVDNYTMADVADRFKRFFYDEHYEPFASVRTANGEPIDSLGLMISGYGTRADQPEIYVLDLSPAGCNGPHELLAEEPGAQWWGQTEAITRLLNGVSNFMPLASKNLGLANDDAAAISLTQDVIAQVRVGIVGPAMPIQDAIDLAEFLVQTTIGFVRFCPGHPTVGGPIEIAAVTKHEGFRWVQRKHYFDANLNPDTGRFL